MRRTALSPVSPKRLAQAKSEGRVLRSTLSPGAPPKRKARLRPVNPARRKRLFARNFGDRLELIHALSCVVPECARQPVQAAHVRARGMGGCKGDKRDLAPLCEPHHREQERSSRDFEAKYGVALGPTAAALARAGDKFLAAKVQGTPEEVKAFWRELAAQEVQG